MYPRFPKAADAIEKLNDYFRQAVEAATDDCLALEDLLEKACKMFHPSHYIPTLTRIKLNSAFLKLGARNEGEAEVELLMRRKEFLDEVHQVNKFESYKVVQRQGVAANIWDNLVC